MGQREIDEVMLTYLAVALVHTITLDQMLDL